VVTYAVGPADTLINTFAAQGGLSTVPATTSPVEGTSELVYAPSITVPHSNTRQPFYRLRPLPEYWKRRDQRKRDLCIRLCPGSSSTIRRSHWSIPPPSTVLQNSVLCHWKPCQFTFHLSWTSQTGHIPQIDAFVGDFEGASSRGLVLEAEIALDSDSEGLPDDYYSTLLPMATRLAYASTVLTVGESTKGVPDPTDVMMFMKNIGDAVSPCVVVLLSFKAITAND
jgi:hypothetical protein